MQVISAPELAQWLADDGRAKPVLLDVREDLEIQTAAMPGITHIPMGQIPARLNDIDENAEIVCICHHGARSMQASNRDLMAAMDDLALGHRASSPS